MMPGSERRVGFESVEVPFVQIDGRAALTDMQLAEDPELARFVERFAHCFERSENRCCYFFNDEGRAGLRGGGAGEEI